MFREKIIRVLIILLTNKDTQGVWSLFGGILFTEKNKGFLFQIYVYTHTLVFFFNNL